MAILVFISSPSRISPILASMLLLAIGELDAQGVVSGQLSIQERAGARTTDLSSAVVWLQASGVARSAPPSTVQIVMESRQYVPRVRVVTTGSRVDFPNQDPFRHNVFSKSGPGEFDLGLFGRGESRGARFDRPGVYPVFCNIHARMLAFVVAVATPYVTQAGSDGRFSLTGIPDGEYTLHVWHDRGGEHQRKINIAGSGTTDVNVQLDARSYRFVQHRNKFGQEYTAAGRDRY